MPVRQSIVNNIGVTVLPEMALEANITYDTSAEIRYLETQRDLNRTIALLWRENSP